MDEPCSSLNPIVTRKLEELIHKLAEEYTIIMVTHHMQQAARDADHTADFKADATEEGKRSGYLVEFGPTARIFNNPNQEVTAEDVSGQFG